MKISKYHLFLVLIVSAAVLITGCTDVDTQSGVSLQTNVSPDNQESKEAMALSWLTTTITDSITGRQTSITELAQSGRPVIIHTFAVWCPACTMQLRETAKLIAKDPDLYTVIGIDIDPRENADLIKRHIEKNGFVGMYVAAPPDMTRSLITMFGTQIIQSLPQTVVVCNKSVVLIGDGVFPEARLQAILNEVCPKK
jgi:thiol-disulfide isomerase/thioredoxin